MKDCLFCSNYYQPLHQKRLLESIPSFCQPPLKKISNEIPLKIMSTQKIMILKRTSDLLFLVRKGHEYKRNTRVCTNMRSLQRMIAFCVQRFLPFRWETSKLCTSRLKPPQPPIRALAGDCGDFHLIYTSFWFPGRQGICLKSQSSINETTSTIKIFWHTH